MILTTIDWTIIIIYFVISLVIGLLVSRRSGSSASEFFLSGRTMPWWLLGISMVATTFSADTPNLVTDLVRKDGVAGNWAWWAFLLTGMLTVFVYARLWRRSGVLTDLEFYELRYSGKEAAFLRGFRAVYLGVFFNVVIMATVCLAAVKIGSVMLGLTPSQTLLIACVVTVAYSAIGGFAGVLWTDFFQFILAMTGAIWAAVEVLSLPEVGGLSNLIVQTDVAEKISMFPDFSKPEQYVPLLIVPLAVQWWSVWYPGAEPGGGGYIAQRMLSAKNEKHAVGATLLFNIAHYALRPWPWIIVALASLVVYPTLADLQIAFPNVAAETIGHDLAYPAMLTLMPAGLKGLIMASLMAAFMSTISTHLNWGSSYIVNDVYKRFINPKASDKMQVNVGRLSTVFLMTLGGLLSVFIGTATEGFNLLLSIGAGTGLIFILRWFWWRINAYTEIAGMIISFVVALLFYFITKTPESPEEKLIAEQGIKVISVFGAEWQMKAFWILPISVLVTTVGWLVVTFFTPPTDAKTLANFYTKIKPYGTGWQKFAPDYSQKNNASLGIQVLCMFIGCITVYAALFATGFFIYGNTIAALVLGLAAVAGGFVMFKLWNRTTD